MKWKHRLERLPVKLLLYFTGLNLIVISVALVVPLFIAIMLFLFILTMDVTAVITYTQGGEK